MSAFKLESNILTSSDGTEIYSEAVGNPKKPQIVFVHGFTISAAVFDGIFLDPKYQQEFYLVRYDTRGHGRSGKPSTMDGHSSKLYADDFMEVIKAYGLRKPTFVGWSLGGVVAVDIGAHLPPDTLSGVVYIGSFISVNRLSLYGSLFAFEQAGVLLSAEASQEDLRSAILAFSDGIFDSHSDCSPYSPAEARVRRISRWDVQSKWLGYGVHQSTQDRQFVLTREQDSTRLFELAKEGLPILIVHGTQDALVHHEPLVKDAKELFKNLTVALIEQGGTHAVFHENPTEVMNHIGAFAEEVQDSASSEVVSRSSCTVL